MRVNQAKMKFAVALAALALLTTACGGDDSPDTTVAAAVETTAAPAVETTAAASTETTAVAASDGP